MINTGMRRCAYVSVLFAALALVVSGALALPAKTPPVTLGLKTLVGSGSPPTAYEFFRQPGSTYKGDIGGIVAGQNYSLVILDIDLTGVTGPAGRQLYFNLQDAESGSSFKHLGISVRLQDTGAGGRALLQAYQQWTGEGISSHGFNAGDLTESDLDLRFDFTKATSGAGWSVTPYYRLSAGAWTVFYDGSYTGTVSFNFLGAKLVAAFDGGADGTVSFSNYYISGAPSKTYVDDAWAGYGNGTAVQFPGETDYRTIGVDAFWTVTAGLGAVTAGGTVYVAAGTYAESVTIGKSVTLSGDRGDPGVAGPGLNAPVMDGTALSAVPAFSISQGVSNVIIEGFEIRNYGPTGNTNADGVVAWNSGTSNVTVRDNYMHDLGYCGVLTGNGWGGPQGLHDNWQVTYNDVRSTGTYGFDMENVKNSAISHNAISAIPWYVINVIALATEPGASVTCENVRVEYNTITGCLDRNINLQAWATGGVDRTATVRNVTVAHNTVTGDFNLIIAWKTGDGTTVIRDLIIDNNTLTVNNPKSAEYAVNLADVAGSSSFSDNELTLTGSVGGGGPFFHGINVTGVATGTWTMSNNELDGNNVGGASVGIRLRGVLPASAVINITHNLITEFFRGVSADALASGIDVNISRSTLVLNADKAVVNGAGELIDARYCWWGAASGPYNAASNPSGTGNAVSDYVLFAPWMTAPNEISVVPASGLTKCGTTITYTFRIEQAGPQEIRGYDVTFQITPAVVTIANIATDVAEGSYLDSAGDGSFYCVSKDGGLYTASGAILGGSVGATGSGSLFTVKFTPVAQGTSPIDVTTLKLRDPDNAQLSVAGVDGSVQVDCTAPTMEAIAEAQGQCYKTAPTFAIFGFDDDVNLDRAEYQIDALGWNVIFTGINAASWDAVPLPWVLPGFGGSGFGLSEGSHTVVFKVKDDAGNWNAGTYSWSFIKDTVAPAPPTNFLALPGHNKVHLTWTNPTADFVGVKIRRVGWTDYPHYATSAPGYPSGPTVGDPVVTTNAQAYDDNPRTPRDIYYYAAFSYDCAGNYSSASPGARDLSTSYWLGDIVTIDVGDGIINVQDVSRFSQTFGHVQGPLPWIAEADFGPTDDNSRFGIPRPDNVVDFEDLMILAMNHGNVSASGTSGLPLLATAEKPLRDLVSFKLVPVSREGDHVTYALVIENGAKVLKGFALKLSYGVGNELVEVKASAGLSGKGSEHFFGTIEREMGNVEVCVAALGVDVPFEYTGEVARVVVREEGSNGVKVEKVVLRDVTNQGDEVVVAESHETPFIPAVSALMQNHPNPFNPVTQITYDVAVAGQVTIEIYDVSGHRVRTLVSGPADMGRHVIEWNGQDENGSTVHTGVYFYRMSAPGYVSPAKKMLLLK
jgi:hypothetical protein